MEDYIRDSAPLLEVDADGMVKFDGSLWKVVPHEGTETDCCQLCHVRSIYGIREAGRKFCPVVPCRASENQQQQNCYLLCWKAHCW